MQADRIQVSSLSGIGLKCYSICICSRDALRKHLSHAVPAVVFPWPQAILWDLISFPFITLNASSELSLILVSPTRLSIITHNLPQITVIVRTKYEGGVKCVRVMVDLKRRRRDTTSANSDTIETKLTHHETLLEVLLSPNPRTMSSTLDKLIRERANTWDMQCLINQLKTK